MKKTLQVANGIALIITIIVNYLSNTGIFNNNTMASVSARYQNLFTPAGYAFSIWGLIYFGLLAFVIYQGRSIFKKTESDDTVEQIGWWFIISCLANSLWILLWLYEYTGLSIVMMLILLFSLLKIVVNTNIEQEDASFKRIVFVWWPFSIYAGWITVALIANISAYLTKIKWEGFGISETSWTIAMICIAGIIHLFMTWKRNMPEFALVGVWALVAIAVANWYGEQEVVRSAMIVAAILFLSSGIQAFKSRRSIPW